MKNQSVICPIALGGLITSLVAFTLALVGCLGPYPFGAVRIPVKVLEGPQALLVYGFTFILPIVLGFLSAGMGAYSFQSIERSFGKMRGNAACAFAVLIGLLTVVISSIASYAVLVYPVVFKT